MQITIEFQSDELRKVSDLDFERFYYKLVKEQPERNWNPELFDIAVNEYKRYLMLKVLYPKKSFAPTSLMDVIWHLHILDTKAYMRDCNSIFGKYLHHAPSFGQYNTHEQNSRLKDSRRNLVELYPKHFDRTPYGLEMNCHGSCDHDQGGDCSGCDDGWPSNTSMGPNISLIR